MKSWEHHTNKRVQVLCRDIHRQADHLDRLQPLVLELQAELRMAGNETRVQLSAQRSRDDNPYDKIMVA
jgi:hypothetical protein